MDGRYGHLKKNSQSIESNTYFELGLPFNDVIFARSRPLTAFGATYVLKCKFSTDETAKDMLVSVTSIVPEFVSLVKWCICQTRVQKEI